MKRQNRSLAQVEVREVQGFGYQHQHSPQWSCVPEQREQLENFVEQPKQEEELEGLLEYLPGFLVP